MRRFAFIPRHPILRVAFAPDGRIVTAQPHSHVAVRDRLTGDPAVLFPTDNAAAVEQLLPHPTLPLVAVGCPKWFRAWALDEAPPVLDWSGHLAAGWPTTTGFAALRRWDADGYSAWEWPPANPLDPGPRPARIRTRGEVLAASPDGRLAVAVRQRIGPSLIDLNTGRSVAELKAAVRTRNLRQGHAVVAFSPDGLKLALGGGDSLAVFDLSRVAADDAPPPTEEGDDTAGKRKVLYPQFTLERPDPVAGRGTHADKAAEHWLPPVAFDPTGRTLLLVGLRNRVQRVEVASGGVVVEWGWRAEAVRSLAVAPDGLTAAAGCRRGELVVWDLE